MVSNLLNDTSWPPIYHYAFQFIKKNSTEQRTFKIFYILYFNNAFLPLLTIFRSYYTYTSEPLIVNKGYNVNLIRAFIGSTGTLIAFSSTYTFANVIFCHSFKGFLKL